MKIKEIRTVNVTLPGVQPKTPARRPSWAADTPRGLPMNKYPEFPPLPARSPGIGTPLGGGAVWVQVTAEDGTWGLGRCGFGLPVAALVEHHFAPLLEGRDCFATEFLSDLMWRSSLRHGAQGRTPVGVPLEEVARVPGTPVPKDGYVVSSDAPGFGLEMLEDWITPWRPSTGRGGQ